MKSILYSCVFLAICLTNSCDKEEPRWQKYHWGEATASKNGIAWKGEPRCVIDTRYPQGIDIIIDVYNEKNFHREDLLFFKIKNEIGNYSITPSNLYAYDSIPGASYGTSIDDGDVAGDSYDLIEGIVENKLTIDKKKGDEIWGTFQVALIKDKTFPPQDPSAPDTVVFTNGKFHTKLLKE